MRRVLRDVSGEEVTYNWYFGPIQLFQTIDDDYRLIKILLYETGRQPITEDELAEKANLSKSKISRRVKRLRFHGIIVMSTDIDRRNRHCREILRKYFGGPEKRRGRPKKKLIFLPMFDEKEREEIENCMKWRSPLP
ncbi:MAG: winged helix-turn-helix transcriptional regulator [Candidatus Korarchaeota archaeon]|nr:winged helix-turn-helix transcriptional regulator [Thermoproteota archaeon]MCR8472598.1 winged helix-turn-helix transcriptional regulator [Thermoproteota archaeon]